MKPLVALMTLAVFVAVAPAHAETPALDSEEDKIFYSLGLAISANVAPLDLTERELSLVQAGLADGALGRDPQVSLQEYGPRIQGALQARVAAIVERQKEQGAAFVAKAAEEPGAVKTESGVVYLELEPGDGPNPGATDTVRIHYHGTLRDGKVFDSSLDGDPATFALNAVIGCFSEGVQKMKVGGKSRLTCPPDTAYGDRGKPPTIGPAETLVFEVQLVEIVGPPEPAPPAAP
jgi:FKBP-type peptidyl-prolyl cis-trans isomerase